jgi:hypothetical protein
MATMFVRHSVKDFAAWKAAYDAFDAERKSLGVTGDGVYRTVDDLNEVTVYHDFASLDEAKSFAGSGRLKEVMSDAGVVGVPDIWFGNPV